MNCTAKRHGTYSAYQYHGCRCPEACEAHRVYAKRLREGRSSALRLDATGTRRRIEALAALGWPLHELGAQLDMHPESVHRIGRIHPAVYRRTAARVAAVYEQLCMTTGPSTRTRNRAHANGWAPPLAWDNIDDPHEQPKLHSPGSEGVDEVRIARAARGQLQSTVLARAEREAVVARLHAARLSDPAIAARTGLSDRTVCRTRRRLELAAIPQQKQNGDAA